MDFPFLNPFQRVRRGSDERAGRSAEGKIANKCPRNSDNKSIKYPEMREGTR